MPAREQTTRRRRRPWRVLAVLVLLLVGLRALLPWLAEYTLERVLSGALAARFEIGAIDLALHEGEIVLEGLTLRTPDTGAELAGVRRVALEIDWGALLSGSLEVERLAVEEPRLLLSFDAEGRFNWAGVGGGSGAEPEAEEALAPSFRLRVARVQLGSGVVRLIDEAEDGLPGLRLAIGAFTLEGVEIARLEPGAPLIWGLATADASGWQLAVTPDPGETSDFALSASAGPIAGDQWIPLRLELSREGAVQLGAEGKLRPVPLEAALHVRWQGLRSQAVFPLLSVSKARVERGDSSGTLEISLSLADVPERGLRVAGQVSHEQLALELEGDTPARLEVARATGELAELRVPIPAAPAEPPEPVLAHWARIEVVEPLLDITLPGPAEAEQAQREESPGAEAEQAQGEESPGAEAAAAPGVDLRVDAFSLRGGRVRWRDPALGADARQTLDSIGVEASQIRWPPAAAERGRLVAGSLGVEPLRVEGSWQPGHADVAFSATRIALAPWDPLLSSYSAYSVSQGDLSLRGRFQLRGERYEAPVTVVLHRLKATSRGNAFQKTFGIPLAAAIPLLSDPAGNIQLEIPVRGHLSEGAKLDLASTIVKALREAITNALVSTLAAPLDLTGSVLRRAGELFQLGIGEAAFEAGQHALRLDAEVVLDSAAGLANRTPRARLELVPQIVSDDLLALGVAPREGGFLKNIASAAKAVFGGSRKLDDEAQERVAALAQARLDAVERHLCEKAGLAPERIVRKPWKGRINEGIPRVLLRLQLKAK